MAVFEKSDLWSVEKLEKKLCFSGHLPYCGIFAPFHINGSKCIGLKSAGSPGSNLALPGQPNYRPN